MRRIFIATMIRGLPPLLCILITMIAFEEGVNTGHVDVPDDAPLVHLYYALGLFTLAGIDLGMPVGGPANWRIGLWMVYFFAPLLSLAAVIDGFIATFRPYISWLWPRQQHLIIAGAGRVTRAFVRELRNHHPRVPVVIVERNPDAELLTYFRRMPGVWIYIGDIYDEDHLMRLHFKRAKGILLLTGDEVANIDAATYIQDSLDAQNISRILPMRIRMADLQLMTFVNKRFEQNRLKPCINIHQDTAIRICRESLVRMHATIGMDILIFVGFGRFSQTFLWEFIQRKGCDEIDQIRILDPRAGFCWAEFLDKVDPEYQTALQSIECILVEGGVRDPRNVQQLIASSTPVGSHSVVLFGTSNDQMNLRAAMRMRKLLSEAYILVRLFDIHHFATYIAEQQDLKLISTANEMQVSMQDWIHEMIG